MSACLSLAPWKGHRAAMQSQQREGACSTCRRNPNWLTKEEVSGAVAMVLAYWADELGRSEFRRDVPEIAAAVFDPNWPGTGNWPFNTAFAGQFPGMRAFVTCMADIAQLEAWVAAGVPPVASVSSDVMNGRTGTGGRNGRSGRRAPGCVRRFYGFGRCDHQRSLG